MLSLVGAGVTGLILATTAGGAPGAQWQIVGGASSAATTLITMFFHVPRNNRLDRVDADTAEGHAVWADYLVGWTRGNHLRATTSALSVGCLVVAASA